MTLVFSVFLLFCEFCQGIRNFPVFKEYTQVQVRNDFHQLYHHTFPIGITSLCPCAYPAISCAFCERNVTEAFPAQVRPIPHDKSHDPIF